MRLVLKTGTSVLMRALHPPDPAARQAVGAARVEQRHDLLLEQVVDGPALDVVLVGQVGVLLAGADGPAVVAVVALDPPAVEDRTGSGRR